MRNYLPVQVLGVLLAIGGLTSVSTPFGIGDVVVRTPIVLSNAAAHVIRAVTGSAAKASAVRATPRSRSIASADADRAAFRPTAVAHPARPDVVRNPETIRMKALSTRLAPAGITAAAGITNVAAHRVNRTRSLRHRIDERTSEPVRLRDTKRERVKQTVAKELKQHRREIEQRNRHRISPIREPRRPHRPPSIRPLHRP